MYTIFHDELSHLPYLTGRDQERSSNMAKNFGKILLGLTAAGAAGAGAAGAGSQAGADSSSSQGPAGDTVNADYEVVDDDK